MAGYWAFVSYSHRDRGWAEWLQRGLETYRLPRVLVGQLTSIGAVPARIAPVFRDRNELPATNNLPASIETALRKSQCLIVVCSPHAIDSLWVSEEIRVFRALGRQDRIFCLLVDGTPSEAIPHLLREAGSMPLAADPRPSGDGKRVALLKLVAGIAGLPLDTLIRRDRSRTRARRLAGVGVGVTALAGIAAFWTGVYAPTRSQAANEHRDADVQRLARESGNHRDDPELSVLLARESVGLSVAAGLHPPVVSEQALRDALARIGGISIGTHQAIATSPTAVPAAIPAGAIAVGEKQIATGGTDGWIRVVSRQTATDESRALLYGHPVRAVVLSRDERRLLVLAQDGSASLLDIDDLGTKTELPSHAAIATVGAFSTDGDTVATGGADGQVIVTSPRGSRALGVGGHVLGLAFLSDQRLAIAAVCERWEKSDACRSGVTVLRLDDGTSFTIPDLTNPSGLRSSEDGTSFVVSDLQGRVSLYSAIGLTKVSKPKARLEIEAGSEALVGIDLSAKGDRLVTFGEHSGVQVVDLTEAPYTPRSLRDGAKGTQLPEVRISRDGELVAVGGDAPMMWRLHARASGEPLAGITGQVLAIGFSPSGDVLVAGGTGADVRRWDTRKALSAGSRSLSVAGATLADTAGDAIVVGGDELTILSKSSMRVVRTLPLSSAAVTVAASSSGRRVAAILSSESLAIVDADRGTRVIRCPPGADTILFSPDERWLVTIDGRGWLWTIDLTSDATELSPVPVGLQSTRVRTNVVRFDASGQRLALGRADGVIALFEVTSKEIGASATFPAHDGEVTDIAFDPHDTTGFVSCGTDGKVRTWSVPSRFAPPRSIEPDRDGFEGWIHSVAISPDGRWLAAGGGHIKLDGRDTLRSDSRILVWRLGRDDKPTELVGHTGWVRQLAFVADGTELLSSGDDGLRIWTVGDAIASSSVLIPNAGGGALDGHHVVALSGGVVRVWPLDAAELVELAKPAVSRDFTTAERARFLR